MSPTIRRCQGSAPRQWPRGLVYRRYTLSAPSLHASSASCRTTFSAGPAFGCRAMPAISLRSASRPIRRSRCPGSPGRLRAARTGDRPSDHLHLGPLRQYQRLAERGHPSDVLLAARPDRVQVARAGCEESLPGQQHAAAERRIRLDEMERPRQTAWVLSGPGRGSSPYFELVCIDAD